MVLCAPSGYRWTNCEGARKALAQTRTDGRLDIPLKRCRPRLTYLSPAYAAGTVLHAYWRKFVPASGQQLQVVLVEPPGGNAPGLFLAYVICGGVQVAGELCLDTP